MNTSLNKKILPHEIFFGAFLFITLFRLMWNVGIENTATQIYIICISLSILLIAYSQVHPTNTVMRLRLFYYFIIGNILFVNMRYAVPLFHPEHMDILLQRADNWLIGGNLSLHMQHYASPMLTEIMSICYMLFFPYLIFTIFTYSFAEIALSRKFYAGLFTLYGIGFICYTFLPAYGPYIVMAKQFSVPLVGYWVTDLQTKLYPLGTNYVDVFPSLHCAISAYILFFDRWYKPWRFRLYLIPCIGIWIATIFLRYHYFIDAICGFALALFSLWVARSYHLYEKKLLT